MDKDSYATHPVRATYEALNRKDLIAMLDLVSDDIELLDIPSGMTHHGKEAYASYFDNWIKGFPDGTGEITHLIGDEDEAVAEVIATGTHQGSFNLPGQTVEATGRRLDLPFCQIFEIEDGKITKIHSYYDLTTIFRNLGLETFSRAA